MNDSPWIIRGFRELSDLASTIDERLHTSRLQLRVALVGGSVGRNVRALGRIIVRGTGRIIIEEDVVLDGAACPIELNAHQSAELVIGRGTVLDAGVSIESLRSIHIGHNCRIGRFVKMMDSAFHPLRPGSSRARNRDVAPPIPVVVEDEVFVGPMAVLLPGTHIEAGVQIEPQRVVSRRVRRPQASV